MSTSISKVENPFQHIIESIYDGIIISDLDTGRIVFANTAAAEMHGYHIDKFLGLNLQQLIHEQSHPLFTNFANLIQNDGVFRKIARHSRKDHSSLLIEWRAVPFVFHEQHCSLAILRDTNLRILQEENLKQRMSNRSQEQSTLLRISYELASTLTLQPDLILNQIQVLIPFTHASLFTLEDSTLITVAVQGIENLKTPLPFQIKINGKKTLETLFNEHKPIRIADITADAPDAIFLRSMLKNDSAILLERVHSWMWVPLAVKKRIVGGIGIAQKERNFFTSHHAELAMTIANQVAITLVNAELFENAQAYAALHERQRIAQNLHDAVNQSLFSAGLIAEVLPRLWEIQPQEARRSLEDLRRLTRGAMAEMRALLAELRPETLIDTELGDLLLLLGNAFSGRTNIPFDIIVTGDHSLPPEIQITLYRICQEVLNNIAKHANATQVNIELTLNPNDIELRIEDNGCGFDTSKAAAPGHYGLEMMIERAESIGADFIINSQPNKGTQAIIRWKEKED